MSLLFLVYFDKAQEFLEVSSTPQRVSISPTSFFQKRNFGQEKSAMRSFFSLWLRQQPLFRTWQPSARAQADPSLDGVDVRSCRSARQVEGRGKTERNTSGMEVGLLPRFFFEFPQPFLQKNAKIA